MGRAAMLPDRVIAGERHPQRTSSRYAEVIVSGALFVTIGMYLGAAPALALGSPGAEAGSGMRFPAGGWEASIAARNGPARRSECTSEIARRTQGTTSIIGTAALRTGFSDEALFRFFRAPGSRFCIQ